MDWAKKSIVSARSTPSDHQETKGVGVVRNVYLTTLASIFGGSVFGTTDIVMQTRAQHRPTAYFILQQEQRLKLNMRYR